MPDRRDPMMPGGDQALEQGCLCPVLDNGHGNVDLARDRGGWWIVSDCPMHGPGGTTPAVVPAQPGSQPIPAMVEVGEVRRGPSGQCYRVELVDSDGWVYLRETEDRIRRVGENVWVSDLEFAAKETKVREWEVIGPAPSDAASVSHAAASNQKGPS